MASVAVIGLGYVGLPLAVEFAKSGRTVLGLDVDAKKVASVNAAASYIPDVPSSEFPELRTAKNSPPAPTSPASKKPRRVWLRSM